MSDSISGYQGIFLPLFILGVVMLVVFGVGVLIGMLVCYLMA